MIGFNGLTQPSLTVTLEKLLPSERALSVLAVHVLHGNSKAKQCISTT